MDQSEVTASKINVTKLFTFEAAHHLPDYDGACSQWHGHSYRLEVTCRGKINPETHMVMDFKYIKDLVQTYILSKLDHSDLNKHFAYPTAEEMVIQIADTLNGFLPLYRVRLWETADSCAEWINTEFDKY
jgi:6-pyruvoyltetrahydropterin/6-carboxytetrahydropterin synthase